MTASAAQPRAASRERIIERPRLIKLLDETDARTILLLAPAGYGKTTLARQWAKTLNGAVWVTLTAAHVDVAWLAEDLAQAIQGRNGSAPRALREHIRARANPQRASRELGLALVEQLEGADARWLILDDYQEIASSREAEEVISTIERGSGARVLIASRVRPQWASGRRFVYGEVFEVSRRELEMTEAEAAAVLGRRPVTARLTEQAAGWPAVIGLAAAVDTAVVPTNALPEALHRYLAEELFQRASETLKEGLLTLALHARRTRDVIDVVFGDAAEDVLREAEALGFSASRTNFELHPLLNEFLLEKLIALPDADQRVRRAVEENVEDGAWDHALALILRFRLFDLVEPTLSKAFKPLARSGRLATLASFSSAVQARQGQCGPTAEVVQAEVAFRDGNLELARDLVDAAQESLRARHPATSHASTLAGHISFLQADFASAERAFRAARDHALDDRDAAEAAYGLALAAVFGEQPSAVAAISELRRMRRRSAIDFLRFVSSEIALRLVGGTSTGLATNLHLDATRQMLPQAEDPRVRTAVTYTIASALTQKADYELARSWLTDFFKDAESFGLEFAMPYANWTYAQIALGQRRFGEAERALQAIEDSADRTRERPHLLNARALRARLLLVTGEAEAAARCVAEDPDVPLIPSWSAEYLATRSLVLACIGHPAASEQASSLAAATSKALEVQGLVLGAAAIRTLSAPPDERDRALSKLVQKAREDDVWDPLLCAIRAAPALGDAIAGMEHLRPLLEALYRRSGDLALARRAGFRTRATATPKDLLSPREYEILGLIARGHKNRDISRALFIAESTTKVHVRHILEKLGVRTRAEAAARLKMLESDAG